MRKSNSLVFAIATTLLVISGCTKEDPEGPKDGQVEQLEGISEDTKNSIPVDDGEIGLEVDTRTLAILGYKPTTVDVEIEGALSSYSGLAIEVDEFTHVAALKIPVKDLGEDELPIFAEGVPVQVTVYDPQGLQLESKTVSKFIFNTSNKILKIETEKTRVLKPLAFNPSLPYYVQLVSDTRVSVLGGSTDYREGSPLVYWQNGPVQFNNFAFGDNDEARIQLLYFEKLEDNIYAIKTAFENSYFEVDDEGTLYWNKDNNTEGFEFLGIEDKHKFILDQTEDGLVKIRPYLQEDYLKFNPYYNTITSFFYVGDEPNPEDYDLQFQILSATVEWEFEDLGTKYSAPIIPPTQMDFAFDQTIINCSSSTGTYEVGTTREETKITTISFEESVNLSSSISDTESATVEAEASGKVFGIGVSVKGSATLETNTTTAFGETQTSDKGFEDSETQTVSTRRSIEVLPYTSIEIFDVIQKIENVSISFAQRFLLRGVDGNTALTGSEIVTQMVANRFGGVVTEVGSDYIIFSVRGSINVDNYFEFKNTLNDIDGGCN